MKIFIDSNTNLPNQSKKILIDNNYKNFGEFIRKDILD